MICVIRPFEPLVLRRDTSRYTVRRRRGGSSPSCRPACVCCTLQTTLLHCRAKLTSFDPARSIAPRSSNRRPVRKFPALQVPEGENEHSGPVPNHDYAEIGGSPDP